MEDHEAEVEQPGKVYGPVAKAFLGLMGVLFALGGLVALLTGEYIGALTMGGLAGACFYALVTGREVHEGAPEIRQLEPCPCCGVPVLNVGWPGQSCLICEWEVGEGADNLGYDLPRAQENFRQHGVYYTVEDARNWGAREITAEEKATKARAVEVLAELQSLQDRGRSAELWREFEQLEAELYRYRNVQSEHGT